VYCPSCGALNDSSVLCSTCGRELAEPAPRKPLVERELVPEPVPAPAPVIEHPCPVHAEMPVGGTCSRCGKFVCIRCAPQLAAGDARCEECRAREQTASDSEGIGGWLILPAITVVLTPLAMTVVAAMAIANGRILVTLLSGLMAGFGAVAAFNFFLRKRQAPLFMIAFYAMGLIVNVAMTRRLWSAGWSLIWIAYFLLSPRVKRTFVK
jgi:hypothetical protein